MRLLLLLASIASACAAGDDDSLPSSDAGEVAITLDLIDPNSACESSFDDLVSAQLEVRLERQHRSPCVSFPQVQDAVTFEAALRAAGLGIDELSAGEATVRLLAFGAPGCDAEVILCAEGTLTLAPDRPRALELTLYCETLDDQLAELFQACVE